MTFVYVVDVGGPGDSETFGVFSTMDRAMVAVRDETGVVVWWADSDDGYAAAEGVQITRFEVDGQPVDIAGAEARLHESPELVARIRANEADPSRLALRNRHAATCD